MRIPELGPFGETFFDARELAIVSASFVKSPGGGKVETVFTRPDHLVGLLLEALLARGIFNSSSPQSLVTFEKLHVTLVLLCSLQRVECSQIASSAGFGILLLRIQTELAGFEFSDHVFLDAVDATARRLLGFESITFGPAWLPSANCFQD